MELHDKITRLIAEDQVEEAIDVLRNNINDPQRLNELTLLGSGVNVMLMKHR